MGVRFVYEEHDRLPIKDQPRRVENVLTPEVRTALPPDLPAKLERMIDTLEDEMITQVIEEIRKHDEVVADVLATLAQRFE